MIKKAFQLFLILSIPAIIIAAAGCNKKKKKVIHKSKISIKSIPTKANVRILNHPEIEDHGKPLRTPIKGELSAGTYLLEFTKAGYKTKWKKIECKADSIVEIEEKMAPLTASIIIKTDPEGANLFSGEKQIGQTPCIIPNVQLGQKTFTLKKPKYSSCEVFIEVDDERPISISKKLEGNTGKIVINSRPTNANIFVDGKPLGKTPSNLELISGEHDIKVEMPGYSTYNQKIAIPKGETLQPVNIVLLQLPGSIKVVTTPPNVNLKVNDKQYNNTPTKIENLKPGKYHIEVSHPNYDTSTRDVTIAAGQDLTVKITLDTNMGGVDLIVHPPGITVYVDGKKVGVTEKGETNDLSKVFEIRNLKSGIHKFLLAHKRAIPTEKQFNLKIEKGKIRRETRKRFWVRDTYLKLKDGTKFTGRIAQENDDSVIFEPDPTQKIEYDRNRIEILRPLKDSE